jgi:hypothetical protein
VSDDVHVGADPGMFLARLRDYEWWLFRGIVFSRMAIVAGLGLILPDERPLHGHGLFHVIVAAWALAAVWVVLPAVRPRRVFDEVSGRRELVWVDVAVLVALLLVGGGWRNPFYLYAWSPIGFASVFWSARRTLLVIGIGCAAQVASFALWHLGGWDPVARHVSVAAWASPLLGYCVAGGAFWYVRRRFDDLANTAVAYRDRAAAAISATQAAAVAAEREEVAFGLHRRLRQVFPALGLRLAALQTELTADATLRAELEQIGGVAAAADATLDDVMAKLRGGDVAGTDRASTFDTGGGASGFIGSTDG